MTDRELELLLDDLPPNDDLVAEITPWRRAANRILLGTALCSITLNFLLLNYLLPAIGMGLILLGFRSLRRENRWFMTGYAVAIIRMIQCIFNLILNATIWNATSPWMTVIGVMLTILHALCVWGSFRAVQVKAGVEQSSRGFWLVIFFVLITVLGTAGFQGTLVILVLLVLYILLLRSLWKYAGFLDDAGYAVQASPVRLSDRTLAVILAVITAAGILCGYLLFNQYPMDWTEQESIGAEAEEIKEALLELDFPEEILDDLAEADILACRDAAKVHVSSQDYPVNDGRRIYGPNPDGTYSHQFVYDIYELRITQIAVEIPGDRREFVLFHHFLWLEDPGFRGTDAIQLWSADRSDGCWHLTSAYSGRVLYSSNGVSYTSAYHFLGPVTRSSTTMFWENETLTEDIAAFSVPRDGSDCRGYIRCSLEEVNPGHILDSWFNYYYQESPLQYPVRTAADVIIPGWSGNIGCYDCICTALQMSYDVDKAVQEGIYEYHFLD